MNNIKQKTFISAVLALFIVLITGCPQSSDKISKPGSSGGNTGIGANPGSGSTVQESGTGNFTKDDLFTVFGLNLQQGQITASEAAKKVAEKNGQTVDNYTFTSREVLAYDDEAGTFKVKVKGHKTAVPTETFEKTFEVKGFTHPYKDASPASMYTLSNVKKLILDEAIKSNLSLKKFIDQANAVNGVGYVFFEIKLSNGQVVPFGKYNAYSLTARLKEQNKQIKINGSFKVIAQKYENGSVSSKYLSEYPLTNIYLPLQDYFTEKDVFEYIAKELTKDSNFLVADAGAYASSKYAFAMVLNNGSSFFDSSKLDKYNTLYNTQAADKHLKITNIIATIDNLRN